MKLCELLSLLSYCVSCKTVQFLSLRLLSGEILLLIFKLISMLHCIRYSNVIASVSWHAIAREDAAFDVVVVGIVISSLSLAIDS